MKTKTQIVQDLLDKKLITAEEAVTLLNDSHSSVVYIQPNYYPYYPTIGPYWITCRSTGTISNTTV
jgi:hypothetical protein